MPAIKQTNDYLSQLQKLPPFICFLIARKGRRPITQAQIMATTGWCAGKVARICKLQSWAEVPVGDVDIFRAACGINRANERRHSWYFKTAMDLTRTVNGLNHLRKTPGRAAKLAKNLVDSVAQG